MSWVDTTEEMSVWISLLSPVSWENSVFGEGFMSDPWFSSRILRIEWSWMRKESGNWKFPMLGGIWGVWNEFGKGNLEKRREETGEEMTWEGFEEDEEAAKTELLLLLLKVLIRSSFGFLSSILLEKQVT